MTAAQWWLADRYRLDEVLGRGGMAVVWRAMDMHMRRAVAVKLLGNTYELPNARRLLAREARVAGSLSSAHIVTVYDFGLGRLELRDDEPVDASAAIVRRRDDLTVDENADAGLALTGATQSPAGAGAFGGFGAYDGPGGEADPEHPGERTAVYVVMEMVRGRNLAQVVAEATAGGRPVAVPSVVEWGRQLAVALEVAHSEDVLHRDIKPANVMVTDRGVLKVLDFGIARFMKTLRAGGTLTRPGAVLGTAAYMSPEQAQGIEADLRSDLYSAGCLLYELLVGEPPFGVGPAAVLLYRHVHEPPAAPSLNRPDVPPALDDLVLALLAKDPQARVPDATELLARIEAVREAGVVSLERGSSGPRPVPADGATRLIRQPRTDGEGTAVPTRLLPPPVPQVPPVPADPPVPPSPRKEAGTPELPTPDDLKRRLVAVEGRPPAEAVDELRALLRDHRAVFGHTHTRTLRVRDDLAYYLGASGDPEAAVRVLHTLVDDYTDAVGAGHAETLRVRENLAHWTGKAGRPREAARLLRELVPDHADTHGTMHSGTLLLRRELALNAGRAGDVREAVRLLRELLPDYVRVFGEQHPRSRELARDLAYWEHRVND